MSTVDAVQGPILCVAGTGPGVGKTTIAAALIRRARALGGHPTALKPIEVGCRYGEDHDLRSPDGDALRTARARPLPPLVAVPFRFPTPTNPLLAARKAGLTLRIQDLVSAAHTAGEFGDVLVVELPSGAMSPLVEDGNGLDLALALEARLLIVDSPGPGSESRVLGLLEAARARKLTVGGVILCAAPPEPEAMAELEALIAEKGEVRVFPSCPAVEGHGDEALDRHVETHTVLERSFSRD